MTLHPSFRFESLVVGAANRTAATAARAVAEGPGSVYNPLFIYARPGLGKTHLLQAVGHHALAVDPNRQVEYLTLDAFVEGFHTAIATGQADAFRRRLAEAELLLVDDVQFLAERREMQAELLRVVDALQSAGRQVVLASDRPPAEIEALDERLIRRFAGGLVIDIQAPDYETRVAILRRRAEERNATFEPGVLEAVAQLPLPSVRELIGALNRLVAFQAVSEAPLGAAQARVLVQGTDDAGGGESGPEPSAPGDADEPDEPRPEPAPAAAPGEPGPDEFGDFLNELAATLEQQVQPWRAAVGDALLRWDGEGMRTAALQELLDAAAPADPEGALARYEAAAERLLVLRGEAESIAPGLAGSPLLSDPANLEAAEQYVGRMRAGSVPPPGPAEAFRLAGFLEGAGNRVALRAARAAAEEPGRKYSPFVVVGASGTGKTHLLHALGHALAEAGAGPVACLSAHEFTQELIDAIDRDAVTAWRLRYRRAGALLLDDVHLVAGKERTQEELFLLFNAFLESGKQLGFTSAVPLAELSGVEPRLLTRFEGGLLVELPPPERELRQRIVERLLADRGIAADAELAAYLASRPTDSVRAVQGLVQRVLGAAEAQQLRPTAGLARDLLEGPTRPARRSSPGGRTSGVVVSPAGGVRSREKMVWEWPDITDRLIEEWR